MTKDITTPLRSFGRRKGRKLRTHAQALMDDLLPTLQLQADPNAIAAFQHQYPEPLWLEIGFGGGEHLAMLAAQHPHIGMIGCEPYVNGISGLLAQIEAQDLKNIGIFIDDVRVLLDALPEHTLGRVYILYPDPWPKSRHHKRRLIQRPLLDALARVMQPGAELRIATDWEDYATWILEQLLSHPAFEWLAQEPRDWLVPWDAWMPTRYEQKARREGRSSCYLRLIRKS